MKSALTEKFSTLLSFEMVEAMVVTIYDLQVSSNYPGIYLPVIYCLNQNLYCGFSK
jgi:hypothetical protein